MSRETHTRRSTTGVSRMNESWNKIMYDSFICMTYERLLPTCDTASLCGIVRAPVCIIRPIYVCVTCLMYMFVTWLIRMCDMTHQHVVTATLWYTPMITCLSLIPLCDMASLCGIVVAPACVTRLVHQRVSQLMHACTIWLIHTCDTTHPHVATVLLSSHSGVARAPCFAQMHLFTTCMPHTFCGVLVRSGNRNQVPKSHQISPHFVWFGNGVIIVFWGRKAGGALAFFSVGSSAYACARVLACARVHACMRAFVCVYVCVWERVCVRACVFACVCVSWCVCLRVCVWVCV